MHANVMNTELMKQHAHYAAVRERLNVKRIHKTSAQVGLVENQAPKKEIIADLPAVDAISHYRLATESIPMCINSSDRKDSLQSIVIETCRQFDVTMRDMISMRRFRHVSFARQIAMWKCRDRTEHSLPRIGMFFKRDHTTVLHACNKIEAMIKDGLIDRNGNVMGEGR